MTDQPSPAHTLLTGWHERARRVPPWVWLLLIVSAAFAGNRHVSISDSGAW